MNKTIDSKVTYKVLYDAKDYNNQIRLVLLNGKPTLLANDLDNDEAVSFDFKREELVKLGRALINAWEQMTP